VKMEHWSATRFMTWELCPVTFEQVYVQDVRGEASQAMLFGQAVHQGLEAHANGADGLASFLNAWGDIRDELLLGRFDSRLTEIGLRLIDAAAKRGWVGLAEHVFTLDTTPAWDAPTVGAIDLITFEGNRPLVRDFKTTTGAWGWERARRDHWQPVLYTWACHEKYGAWPDFEYWVGSKMTAELEVFRIEGAEVLSWEQELQDRAAAIVARVRDADFACHGQHGICLECGERWGHDHVCDMNVRSPRISDTRTRI